MEKSKRRRFTAEYRLRILEAAERCREPGEVGRLLRREGLYSSHLTARRKARRHGALRGPSSKKRGARAGQCLIAPLPTRYLSRGYRTLWSCDPRRDEWWEDVTRRV